MDKKYARVLYGYRVEPIDTEVYKADEVDAEIQGYKDELAKYVIDMGKLEARIQELEEENEELDTECTKRQLEIYRLRKALEMIATEYALYGKVDIERSMKYAKTTYDIATEALKEE